MYFLVFLLVLVIAFIASYFFRDTIKRIFGGGDGSSALLGLYSVITRSTDAAQIVVKATALTNTIKVEVGADGNLQQISNVSTAILQEIIKHKQIIDDSLAAYTKIMKDEIQPIIQVNTDKLVTAFTNKTDADLRNAFQPPLDAIETNNPHITNDTFVGDAATVLSNIKSNLDRMETAIYAKIVADLSKIKTILKSKLVQILTSTQVIITKMDQLNNHLENTYKMENVKTSDTHITDITETWNSYEKTQNQFEARVLSGEKDGRDEYITDIQASLPDLTNVATSPAKEHKEVTDLFTAMKAGMKIGSAVPLASYKEWIDQWKESFAAKEVFKTEIKKRWKTLQDVLATLGKYKNLDGVLQHLDTIKVINGSIKNVQTLKDDVKIAAITALGKIRTAADKIIKDEKINEYAAELTNIAKTRPNDLKAAVEKYIVDIEGLEVFKKQAQKVEDDATTIQKSYEQLDSLLVHENALTKLEKVDKYILSLGYSGVHTEIKELEKLRTDAEAIIKSNIPKYKADLDIYVKALNTVKVQKVIDDYVAALTKLSSLKSSAESIKEIAETNAAQERSLDSSSGDYVFDSQEIISDTKLEEMISQGKEDEIEATLFRNIDIPKQEIEKIIKKRKEKLMRK